MSDIEIGRKKNETAIIFCNSINSCRSTEYLLRESGYEARSIHGDVPAKARIQNYNDFKEGRLRYLVCTDLGSRGLDFKNNGYVVNFDFPNSTADYLHRVGRTGRAGRHGTAFSLIRKKNFQLVKQLKDSFEYGVPIAIGNSSYTKHNREMLKERQKLEVKDEKNVQLNKRIDFQSTLPDNYIEFRNEKYGLPAPKKPKKVKGSKNRPQSRELKAYKKVIKDAKKIPKGERHQRSKMMDKIKRKKKNLTKVIIRQKNEGWD